MKPHGFVIGPCNWLVKIGDATALITIANIP